MLINIRKIKDQIKIPWLKEDIKRDAVLKEEQAEESTDKGFRSILHDIKKNWVDVKKLDSKYK